MEIREFAEKDHPWARNLLAAHMGSAAVALRGKLHDPMTHPGFVAEERGSPVGLMTYIVVRMLGRS